MTVDKKIDEGSFKLFFTDGSSTPQYGSFGSFFPGDSRTRSYTWEYLKALVPMNISYNSEFFSSEPSSLKLNWAPPGKDCNLMSLAAKAAANKAAANKAAADKAAADKAAADKAAVEKATEKADAARAAADAALAAADKAAADKAAAQEAADKAAADKAAAEKIIQDAKLEAARILSKAKAEATKKTTVTCVKGKVTKKVTAVSPKCPSGYKKK
jgi:hypothetical protein